MPKNTTISPEVRARIATEITAGGGRNDIARRHGVSTGYVTKVARQHGLMFQNHHTVKATQARQIDQWAERVDREDALEREYLALERTFRSRDCRPTRAERRLSYALYNVNRHHNGTYR